ncbi:hypothetical protein [Acanthopleuribacter pedis]|uniref:Uncharacterized protein n=1 Tax=Acanthopleuribacter pedis TaxID=442870 RepID=A0A8J7QHA4_9BACT|nr:hypothetical protein [Acanthopleuribacter pedis]MBO1320411.1 hypothetical protein [Acanthopleuribacter pedis]
MNAIPVLDMYEHLNQFLPFKNEMLYFHLVPTEADDQPCIRYRDRLYNNLPMLLDRAPHLGDKDELPAFAQIVNFMLAGGRFSYIEHPQSFCVEYERMMSHIEPDMEPAFHRHGPFETDEISKPSLEADHLQFYVYQRHTMVPYRVTCPFPRITAADNIPYELLPYRC